MFTTLYTLRGRMPARPQQTSTQSLPSLEYCSSRGLGPKLGEGRGRWGEGVFPLPPLPFSFKLTTTKKPMGFHIASTQLGKFH